MRTARFRSRLVLDAAASWSALAFVSCAGPVAPAPRPAAVVEAPLPDPGPSPIRRLTRFEYNNTVRDFFGDDTRPADAFPPEEQANGFDNEAGVLTVSRLLAEQYLSAAHEVAARAVGRLPRFLGCDLAREGEAACFRVFLNGTGTRIYRRPLEEAQKARLSRVFTGARAGRDFAGALSVVIETMLQSPQFLYRVEAGAAARGREDVVRLDHWEMASRLSYLVWGSMPDDRLFAAARAGRLGTRPEIEAEARRLLGDRRARLAVAHFHELWLRLKSIEVMQRDPKEFKTYTADLSRQLRREADRFLDHVVWDGPGDLGAILTAPFTFMNARLARFYGAAGVDSDELRKVDLDPRRRLGLLTQAGIIGSLNPGPRTNPVKRGHFVRERLLCQPPPPPPPDLNAVEPKPDPKLTTRERFTEHRESGLCGRCHKLMDPIGLGFEHYDAIGQWRDQEHGKPIDDSGEIVGTDVAGEFSGVPELARKLAASDDVRRCLVSQWFAYAYGRRATPEDRDTEAALEAAFARSGHRIRELVVALTQTDAFIYRRRRPGP